MSGTMDDRVLALAGLVQALAQVRRMADTGQPEAGQLAIALDSVFRIDAADTAAVFGDPAQLGRGLRVLRNYLANTGQRDEGLARLALAVLQVERRFTRDDTTAGKVQLGLRGLAAAAERLGSAHPDVIAGLGSLYADTVSHLRPRVMVQGNPHYLAQSGVVAEIRALLLAALRAAVLWRQMGGSLWDFLFARKQMAAALDARLR